MFPVKKDPALDAQGILIGLTEVTYPPLEQWHTSDFYALTEVELSLLKGKYADYDRGAVFDEHPCHRFFQKWKKPCPILVHLESLLLKNQPFPQQNPLSEIAFVTELYSLILTGAHDADAVRGILELCLSSAKESFLGLQGGKVSACPGDVCGRDGEGILFSVLAGPDKRTCVTESTRHVLYPVFGAPGLPKEEIRAAQVLLDGCAKVLAPDAKVESVIL